ncbi:hypothetical protein DQ04_00141260 [Trypanosoma grayi]|uniref:hypothetical protein n=1 Tax=Trypanosoma grayi TaxID=71804 RepID=UPI0004F409D0|nr:hypothetical protein DQ04_00141260 [Trypanosoma grayi]KEG15238.1 hypothetical protein DQ04_00141260 [Trypanosoma grayi]
MIILRRTNACLSAKKIPFVLCGSRFSPAVLRAELAAIEGGFQREFPDASLTSPLSGDVVPCANTTPHKKQKRRAFDVIVRWCGAHQKAAMQSALLSDMREEPPNTVASVFNSPSHEADEAAMRWLEGSSGFLTCGQTLLVCSFVCEVLLCRLDAAAAAPEAAADNALRQQVGELTNRIVALLQRANASDKLETQPLSILMSCTYGVHRLASSESELLGEAERALLRTPTALMFAVLHQLRGDALVKLFELEARAAVDVCLSFLYIADEERRQMFLTGGDTVLMNTILRRLVRYIASSTKQLKETTLDEDFAGLLQASTSKRPSLCGAKGGTIAHSPSMRECLAIMQNIAFSSAAYRLEVLTYLLCVRRSPALYTQDEVRLLPSVLQTVANIRSEECRSLRAKVIFQTPFPEDDPALVAELFSHAPHKKAPHLTYLNLVEDNCLSSADAMRVILSAGVHLDWEAFQRFVASALPNNTAGTSLPKQLLSDAMECVLSTLLKRMAEMPHDTERDETREYALRLARSIDWAASKPPVSARLALQRLVLLTDLSNSGFPVDAPDAVLALSERALDLESGSSMTHTLRCVMEALPLVPDNERRQKIVECMLRYNGTRSSSSVIRCIAFLTPLIVEHGLQRGELVQQMLKMQTLNPLKLRQNSIEGMENDTDVFTLFIIQAMNYVLASEEWRTSTDRIREVMSLWIHDYLRYVMDLSRRHALTEESAQRNSEAASSHVNREETTVTTVPTTTKIVSVAASSLVGPTHERFEEVLVCVLRAGVKMPDFFGSELSIRVRQIERDGASVNGTKCKTNFPPPGHFVFCCKLDIAMDSPLSSKLLEYLLTTCDCRTLHLVIIAFLTNAKVSAQDARLSLVANLRLASHCLELFLRRVDEMGDATEKVFRPSSLSSVSANMLRFIVGYLTKQERNRRVLERLHDPQHEETKEPKENEVDSHLVTEQARIETLLTRVLVWLSAAHVKDLGLLLLDRMAQLAPAAAEYLLLRLTSQLEEFTQVELFYLARKCPKSQDLVMKELKKYDIALSVDLSDHVRVAGSLPMAINEMVIEAHLPSISFHWCTRLLSALSVRHETIPMHLLASILRRLEEETENATVMDRNVALVVLQKYLNFEHPLKDETESCERRRLIERTFDQLLVLEGINSLDTLSGFLSEFPDALRGIAGDRITEHVLQAVFPGMLTDLEGLLTLCRLLHKHKLLSRNVRLGVAEGFFVKTLRVESANAHGDDTDDSVKGTVSTSSPQSATSLVVGATYPLGNVLALALLLSTAAVQPVVTCDRDAVLTGRNDDEHVDTCVLQAVKERYSSLQDRLIIVSALVEQRETAGTARTQCMVAEEICEELIQDCEKLTPSEFSRLLQCISRLKCWHMVKLHSANFGSLLQQTCRQADAHSRCVVFKAVSLEADLFRNYESFMMPLLTEVVDVMSKEDLEMVLSAVLSLPLTEPLESLIDAMGTRVLAMVDQCRRSTLIRMLQCHAAFGLQDDVLVGRLLTALEEQCGREARLDTTQVLTLLQAVVDLDVPIPAKLAITCFMWLEHHVESMTTSQLGQAARLAVNVEMGYTASVHTVAMRALEQRDAIRSNAAFRNSVELLCDEFSVETPWHLKAAVLRRRYQAGRLKDYCDKRRSAGVSASPATTLSAAEA